MVDLNDFFANEKIKCERLLASYYNSTVIEGHCPPDFDGYYCWPATPPLSLVKMSCALEYRENEFVYRWCSANTTEISGTNISVWQNAVYGVCSRLFRKQFNNVLSIVGYAVKAENSDYLMWWHEKLNIVDAIGLGLSIIFLMTALSIFLTFSQLQDTRVKIHINLFTAMLLNAIASLTHNLFYGRKVYFTILIDSTNANNESSIICRSLMTLSHYFELNTFTWILIEGWYFYSFISRAPYNNYVPLKPYIFTGWGLPLTIIIPWIIVHVYAKHTNFCWVDNDIKLNIMAIPIFLIVLVNLTFFILNVKIIFIKMKDTYMSQKRMDYWKWIKSSLMLVPLFGTYDVLYVTWPWIENAQTKIYFLLIVRVICSFQGCIVSTMYCFANNSVKKEINRAWYTWKLKREIDSQITKRLRISENPTKTKLNDQIDRNIKIDLRQPDFNNYF